MKKWIEGCLLAATLTIASCTPAPNPAAVLEDTWRAVFDEPGELEGFDIQLTFNADGTLVEVTAESPDGGAANLNVDNSTTTEVDGNQVTGTIPIAVGTRVFEGTLSDDESSIDGSLSQELELPSGDLDVTFARQRSDFTAFAILKVRASARTTTTETRPGLAPDRGEPRRTRQPV